MEIKLTEKRKRQLEKQFKDNIINDFRNGVDYKFIAFKYGVSQADVLNTVEQAKAHGVKINNLLIGKK